MRRRYLLLSFLLIVPCAMVGQGSPDILWSHTGQTWEMCLAASDSGCFIQRTLGDAQAYCCDLLTGEPGLYLGNYVSSASFSADGTHAVVGRLAWVDTWDLDQGKLVQSRAVDGSPMTYKGIELCGVAENDYDEHGSYSLVSVLDLNTGFYDYFDSGGGLAQCVLSEDGSLFATNEWANDAQLSRIWDRKSHTLLYVEPEKVAYAISSDDDHVAIQDYPDNWMYSLSRGEFLYDLPGPLFAFSPDGTHFITFEDFQLSFADTETGAEQLSFALPYYVDSVKWRNGFIICTAERGNRFTCAMFDPFTVQHAIPSALTILRGNVISGGVGQLVDSDDEALNIGLGRTVTPLQAPIEVEIDGTTTANSVSILQFKIESSATRTQIIQIIDLYDYVAGAWVPVDSRNLGTSDAVVDVNVGENTSRFLQNGHVRARLSYRKDGGLSAFPWTVKIDQVKWTMAP
jgi:hypothetical protein